MWMALRRLASSMKGFLSTSDMAFQRTPSFFEISELCIFGFSSARVFRWTLDQTMKAFIGRFTLDCAFGETDPEFARFLVGSCLRVPLLGLLWFRSNILWSSRNSVALDVIPELCAYRYPVGLMIKINKFPQCL